jgi:mono/diheme cytochrome c family protein
LTRILSVFAALAAAAVACGPATAQDAGQAQFLSTCSACHQPTGLGIPGAFPPLAGSATAQGDPVAAASLVLNGRGGMPSFSADLSDAQIAAALTYVRSAWGNAARPVTAAQVATARASAGAAAPAQGLQAH